MKTQILNKLEITRVANACVLMKIGSLSVLTDPFFYNPSYMGIDEQPAMKVKELPILSAIIGCHSVPDHWQIQTLASYPHKDKVPVFVATKSMAKKAKAIGFRSVEVLEWGNHRKISDSLNLETLKAHKSLGMKVNSYVLRDKEISVFFGSEARDLEPLREYRRNNPKVDVVLAPVNAVHLFGFFKLVMSGKDAVVATKILGAKILFVIHDSHRKRPFLIGIKSSGKDAIETAKLESEVEVIRLRAGKSWKYG